MRWQWLHAGVGRETCSRLAMCPNLGPAHRPHWRMPQPACAVFRRCQSLELLLCLRIVSQAHIGRRLLLVAASLKICRCSPEKRECEGHSEGWGRAQVGSGSGEVKGAHLFAAGRRGPSLAGTASLSLRDPGFSEGCAALPWASPGQEKS